MVILLIYINQGGKLPLYLFCLALWAKSLSVDLKNKLKESDDVLLSKFRVLRLDRGLER